MEMRVADAVVSVQANRVRPHRGLLAEFLAAAVASIGAVALDQPLLWLIAAWYLLAVGAGILRRSPEADHSGEARPVSPPGPTEFDECFMPPVRREHIKLAREARARATDKRTYWTKRGLAEGKAPPTIRSDRPG